MQRAHAKMHDANMQRVHAKIIYRKKTQVILTLALHISELELKICAEVDPKLLMLLVIKRACNH